MMMLAEMGLQNWLTVGAIVVGAIVAFWLIHKIVKFVLSVVIVVIIAAAAVFYCVKAGYISDETAEKMNPLRSERIVQAAKDAGAWAAEQTRDAVKKAVGEVVRESVEKDTAED